MLNQQPGIVPAPRDDINLQGQGMRRRAGANPSVYHPEVQYSGGGYGTAVSAGGDATGGRW